MPTLNLSPEYARGLYDQLEQQRKSSKIWFWSQSSIFPDFDIVCRKRKGDKPGLRYELVDKTESLGRFNKHSIYRSAGTLTPQGIKLRGTPDKRGQARQRLVKYQKHSDTHPVYFSFAEYEAASQSGLLHMKYPTIIDNNSFLTMKELPGRTLRDIMDDDYKVPGRQLSNKQRVQLSIALLQALRDQVSRHAFIHRDIKPANIMIYVLPDDTPRVTIIDFGYSVQSTDLGPYIAGSRGYYPPEIFHDQLELQSTATDIYSMACVLLEVWRIPLSVMENVERDQKAGQFPDQHRSLKRLFDGITGIDLDTKNKIKNILGQMLRTDPARRPRPATIIKVFRKLIASETEAPSVAASSTDRTSLPPPSGSALRCSSSFFSASRLPAPSSSTLSSECSPCRA